MKPVITSVKPHKLDIKVASGSLIIIAIYICERSEIETSVQYRCWVGSPHIAIVAPFAACTVAFNQCID